MSDQTSPLCLGIDTGGTYTDAVILDEAAGKVIARAKALTSRPDLSIGIAGAIDAVMAEANVSGAQIAMVSLSTTLATNALVEGQGGRVALVFIGFAEADLARDSLQEALAGDPVILLAGGHGHSGGEAAPFDEAGLRTALADVGDGVTGFAVAAQFATRNPAHEEAARAIIREVTGRPVTCSHELSAGLGGPKRALTAVLNARLIGMIDGLITACEGHLATCGIDAPLMVVRGDGALVAAVTARDKPIETILSGPAASIAGAHWLTGEQDALVSDIGGTTTDVCLLRGGRPAIDPQGARVGPYRTMVEAVAMRTTGLGGDSAVHLTEGLHGGLRLGPRRLMPVALLATQAPDMVHRALDLALRSEAVPEEAGRFAVPLVRDMPAGLDPREEAVLARVMQGACPVSVAVQTRVEGPAMMRLVARGLLIVSGVTPSDAAHVLGWQDGWDTQAAAKALTLMAKRRQGHGDRLAEGPEALARMIVSQLEAQTQECLLDAAFAEDPRWAGQGTEGLSHHALTRAGLAQHRGVVEVSLRLGVPVIGLGASAAQYYPPLEQALGCQVILPADGGVANAIGAVVGQVEMRVEGTVLSGGAGSFIAHLAQGPQSFDTQGKAMAALEAALTAQARAKAQSSGVEEPRIQVETEVREAEIEGQPMFVEATMRVRATGRPRIADHSAG